MGPETILNVAAIAGSVFGGSWYLKWFLSKEFTRLDARIDKTVPVTICDERRGVYLKEVSNHASALGKIITKKDCDSRNASCSKGVCKKIDNIGNEQLELWSVINHHGHRGLEDKGNEVVRPG